MLSDVFVGLTLLSCLALIAGLIRPRLFGGGRGRALLIGGGAIVASLLGAGASLTPAERVAIDTPRQVRLDAAAIADGMRGAAASGNPVE